MRIAPLVSELAANRAAPGRTPISPLQASLVALPSR